MPFWLPKRTAYLQNDVVMLYPGEVEGDAADELDVEMDHFPRERPLVDGDLGATKTAGTVFHDGIGLGQDFFKILGPGFAEGTLDFMKCRFCRFDRLRSGEDGGGE